MSPAVSDVNLIVQLLVGAVAFLTIGGCFIGMVTGWIVMRIQIKENARELDALKLSTTSRFTEMQKENERADRDFGDSMKSFALEVNSLRTEMRLLTQELHIRGQLPLSGTEKR